MPRIHFRDPRTEIKKPRATPALGPRVGPSRQRGISMAA